MGTKEIIIDKYFTIGVLIDAYYTDQNIVDVLGVELERVQYERATYRKSMMEYAE